MPTITAWEEARILASASIDTLRVFITNAKEFAASEVDRFPLIWGSIVGAAGAILGGVAAQWWAQRLRDRREGRRLRHLAGTSMFRIRDTIKDLIEAVPEARVISSLALSEIARQVEPYDRNRDSLGVVRDRAWLTDIEAWFTELAQLVTIAREFRAMRLEDKRGQPMVSNPEKHRQSIVSLFKRKREEADVLLARYGPQKAKDSLSVSDESDAPPA